MEKVACNAAALIEDGSCLAFSIGPVRSAGQGLKNKRHLGIHSPFFTDPLMDLIQSGAVTNRAKKATGKSLTSYAFGTPELFAWLHNNPLVEFQRIDKVFNPQIIGRNPRFVTIIAARKIDLYGRVGLYAGKGNIATGPSEVLDFLTVPNCPRRAVPFLRSPAGPKGEPNILPSIADWPNQFGMTESVSTVVTEHGVAYLEGRTVRERAQALIEVAHPDDRRSWSMKQETKSGLPRSDFSGGKCPIVSDEISATLIFKGM